MSIFRAAVDLGLVLIAAMILFAVGDWIATFFGRRLYGKSVVRSWKLLSFRRKKLWKSFED